MVSVAPGNGDSSGLQPLRLGSLCTGYGGLDLAIEQALGASPVWLCEFDKHPAAVCEARFPGVPNLHDLTALDWQQVPPVDVLCAGYPCQPFSRLGRREGTNDARHLWPYIADAIRVLRPRLVVLENVASHLSLGFDIVLGDLAELGFDAEWSVVRASDVGACHRRERLFVVAAPADAGGERRPQAAGGAPGSEGPLGRRRGHHLPRRHGPAGGSHGGVVEQAGWGEYAVAVRRHAAVLGRPAPAPVDAKGRLAPRFVEWMMMLPEGWVTDVVTSHTAQSKLLGNGVVPPCAAHAVNGLLARLERGLVAA